MNFERQVERRKLKRLVVVHQDAENSQESLLTQEVKEYKINKMVTLGLSVIT